MFDALARDLQLSEAAPGVLASAAGVLLVWSAPFVWACIATGRVPRRLRNLAFWLVGGWHVAAAAVLIVVFGVHHVVLAFLAGGAFAHAAGLYLGDGDVDAAYERFDTVGEDAKPVSDEPAVSKPRIARVDAA